MTPPSPAGADAARSLLTDTLAWLRTHMDWAREERWNSRFPEREVPVQTALELLMLCRVLERAGRGDDAAPLRAGAEAAASPIVERADLEAAADDPEGGFTYLLWAIHLMPDRLAEAKRRAHAIVERRGAGLARLDQPRTMHLELAYAAALGGAGATLPGFAALYGARPYAGRRAGDLDDAQAYAVTHDVLYATDFGAVPLPLDPEAAAEVGALVRALLRDRIDAAQWDLTAELAHCAIATAGDRGIVDVAFAALADARLDDGAVPGPPYDAALAAERTGDERAAYAFRTCYHTTLVTAMAAAAIGAEAAA